jgi:hypothetical protein
MKLYAGEARVFRPFQIFWAPSLSLLVSGWHLKIQKGPKIDPSPIQIE